jgi:phosphatidylserine/phosphatidylglycerophosphate/cardiolipin synthase-like enzyme
MLLFIFMTFLQPVFSEVIFSSPTCPTYSLGMNWTGELTQTPTGSYCTGTNHKKNSLSKINQKVQTLLNKPIEKKITLSTYKFSDTKLRDILCKAIVKHRTSVRLISSVPSSVTQYKKLQECVGNKHQDRIEFKYEFSRSDFGLYHAKMMMIEYRSLPTVDLFFGGSNLTASSYLNHDNWVYMSKPKSDPFVLAHQCFIDTVLMTTASRAKFRKQLASCLPKAITGLYFSPGGGEVFLRQLIDEIRTSSEVFLSSHRFSSWPLYEVLLSELKRGLKVKILLDAGPYAKFRGDQSHHDLIGSFMLVDLLNHGAEIRFVQSNFVGSFYWHHKFMLTTKGKSTRLFLTSANFTTSALQERHWDQLRFIQKRTMKTNIENHYILDDRLHVSAFRELFDRSWMKLASSLLQLPLNY